jgi:hypothetical protein
MLREQTIVMHTELGTLDHGAAARPTVPQRGSTARNACHEAMVTRTYVRAREAERAQRVSPRRPGAGPIANHDREGVGDPPVACGREGKLQ